MLSSDQMLDSVQVESLFEELELRPVQLFQKPYQQFGSPSLDQNRKWKAEARYQQFVETVAEARSLSVEKVKSFADGRIFTGQQALELGVVDRLGTEEDARCWTAELVGLDPEKTLCYTLEERKPLLNRVLSGNRQAKSGIGAGIDWLEFEMSTSGLPMWLYRP